MNITTGRIREDSADVDALVRDYYARTIAHEGMRPLNFKWRVYQALEDAHACKLFLAHEDNKLIGFALYVVQEHFHHDDQVVAQCSMIGVKPEYRNNCVGRALIEYAEKRLKKNGATHMVHHHRTLYKVTPLFERMGFRLEELGYVKEL